MNRLKLAALAPPVPDWYLKLDDRIFELIKLEDELNSDIIKRKGDTNLTISRKISSIQKEIEFDWRFYWADEMIKRNEKSNTK